MAAQSKRGASGWAIERISLALGDRLQQLKTEHDSGPQHCDYCLLVAALKTEEMEVSHVKALLQDVS